VVVLRFQEHFAVSIHQDQSIAFDDIFAQGKTSTATGRVGLGLIVASLTQYPV